MKWLSGLVLLLVIGAAFAWWLFKPPPPPMSMPVVAELKVEEVAADTPGVEEKSKVETVIDPVKSAPVPEQTAAAGDVDEKKPDPAGQRPAPQGNAAGQRPTLQVVAAEIGKEAYNAVTEIKAALDSQSWDDAARLVTSLDSRSAPGIAPYAEDKRLLTSVAVAAELVLLDYAQVREVLQEKHAALGELRVAQATAAGDAARVELATIQFEGTPAAAAAHQWLGHRALALGLFDRARWHYERAAAGPAAIASELGSRIRLAGAMLGRDLGQPPDRTVEFGDVSISPTDFEALVGEMRQRAITTDGISPKSAWPVPKPGQFEAHVRSRLDGPVGDRPQDEMGRRTNQLRVPWVDRQIATVVEADILYVANHFQVAAYRLTTGERIWQSEKPPGQMQRAQEWTSIPMRPLIAGDRIFVRLMYSQNPVLICYEKSSGKLLWVAESREREAIVSDPLLVDGQLVALSIMAQGDQRGMLNYCAYDRRTGEILWRHEFFPLSSEWRNRSCCEVAEVDNGLVAALGGATIAIGGQGDVRWLRLQESALPEDDPRSVLQMYDRPLVDGDRVFVTQPGVRRVECLAARTGRLHWSAELPGVVGTVGLANDLLLIRTESQILALNVQDGETRWRYDAGDLYSFQLLNRERLLIAGRELVPGSKDAWQIVLHWINPSDGTNVARSVVRGLQDTDPRLGPLVASEGRVFSFFGYDGQATREVIELVDVDR